ncbi:ABC transporter permease [Ornithinibacillus bavariensis]|uniref:Peptide ABC transporter permease n=1 Tax=Ornithinibacillus bavariensis TaxID=545502 RepID=A0A919X9K1_9BACI|nr:ABC transporter permease [Ornithinibacillus bavariensis]GIO27015.1 peptide ABC transporter permease [Ornithinibacillus bavariensis]HAM80089.1 peptide ABC transporter permease [Ornithinibacillus sp.]
MKRLRNVGKHINLLLGGAILVFFLVMMTVSFFYTPYGVEEMDIPNKLQSPSAAHLLGTDEFGRDIFSRMMKGTQTAFFVGIVAVGIGLVVGTIVGGISGYLGGWVDEIIMRVIDALMAFPGIILALMLVAVFGSGMWNTAIALGLMAIPGIARIARSGFLQTKEQDFVLAAKAMGIKPITIMFRHILPNVSSPLIVAASIAFAVAILAEAGLSYLGLGVQPPDPSWGRMLKDSQPYLVSAPWYTYAPGVAITLVVLGFYMLSNAISEISDPRMRD